MGLATRYTSTELVQIMAKRLLPMVTTWNRLEGRPRTRHFDRALRAEVRDPLWMLSKQWQLGEFRGEDAGSPVGAKVLIQDRPLTRYRPGDHAAVPFSDELPLECIAERREVPFQAAGRDVAVDLRLAMGRYWLRLLATAGLDGYAPDFVSVYGFDRPDPSSPGDAPVAAHPEEWQRHAAIAGRSMDGFALYSHLTADTANTPADDLPAVDPGDVVPLTTLGDALVEWYDRWMEQPEGDDAWQPERLEYQCAVAARDEQGDEVLTAREYYHGRLDWFNFDRSPGDTLGAPAVGPPGPQEAEPFIPAPVEFDGMPHPRWWQFEEGRTDFGGVTPSTTDLGKLLFMEFSLVYSNDWFLLPYRLPAGTVSQVRGLTVTNVFGETTWVNHAGTGDDVAWQGWNMYALSAGDGEVIRPELLMLPTVPKIQESQRPETVMFIRDEMANQVWGIERMVRLPSGVVRRGIELAEDTRRFHERLLAEAIGGGAPADHHEPTAAFRYDVMTTVPEHWIPFVPVHVDGSDRDTRLQRAAMLRIMEGDPDDPEKVRPRTQVLRHGLDLPAPEAYYLAEEEVPRAGVFVADAFQRTRWYGGKVVLWRGMRKHTGRGEGSSGLAFDTVVPQPYDETTPPGPVLDPGHTAIELDSPPFPSAALAATPDPRSGWNLQITLQDFTVAPEHASTAHVAGEGHLHLRIGGVKVTRVYGEWFHLPPLPEGEHEIAVELSANDHSPFLVEGAIVAGVTTVTQGTAGPSLPPAGTIDVPAATAPAVTLVAHPDPASGYNLWVQTSGFTWAPENASGAHVAGEGHARLFVDGDEHARIYGQWFYLPALAVGSHEVRVELVANDHRTYAVGGSPIDAAATIEVAASDDLGGGHHP